MKVSVRKNLVKLELSQDEEDILFRIGLQIIADKHCKGKRKVLVLPPDKVSLSDINVQKIEASKEMIEECFKEALTEALKQYIKKMRN